jgi:hypothetical protein
MIRSTSPDGDRGDSAVTLVQHAAAGATTKKIFAEHLLRSAGWSGKSYS